MEDKLINIPLKNLKESKTNPRKNFLEASLKELAESIKQNGVIKPVLVRPLKDTLADYELVDGARRFRASKLAELKDIPAIVRILTDEQVQVVQLISFLQNEDVHPLDESDGYLKLLDTKLYDVPAIAAKVGKSESYIYQRLQLQHLTPAWKSYFVADVISLGHALLLARLTEGDQSKAEGEYNVIKKHWKTNKMIACSIVELKQWIEDNCYKKLSQAGWNLNDAELVKDAGSCKDCPKRTGFNKTLFNDVKSDDICTDGKCFKRKQTKFFNSNLKSLTESGEKFVKITLDNYGSRNTLGSEDYKKAKPKDKKAIKGIVSEGAQKGKVFNVIAPESAVKSQKRTSKVNSESAQDQAEIRAKEQLKKEQLKKKTEIINEIRIEIFKEIIKKQKVFSQQDWHLIVSSIVESEFNWSVSEVFKFAGIKNFPNNDKQVEKYLKSLKLPELQKYIMLIITGGEVEMNEYAVEHYNQSEDLLLYKAKELKIDTDVIINRVEAEYKKEEPKPEKPKSGKSAKKKSTKK